MDPLQKQAGSVILSPVIQPTLEKSWYEQTIEEEEANAAEAQLESRFTNSIRLEEERAPLDHPVIEHSPREFETNDHLESEANMEEGDAEAQQGEVEAYEMDWEENNNEDDRVDSEWTEEDEAAYHDTDKSLLETGELLEDDDLLGEKMDEPEIEMEDREIPPPVLELGCPKLKGKKKDKNKMGPSPKAQYGVVVVKGEDSRKLFNLHGRFSPKCQGNLPAGAKPKQAKPLANLPGHKVYPAFTKSKAATPKVSTGGSIKPPGTNK